MLPYSGGKFFNVGDMIDGNSISWWDKNKRMTIRNSPYKGSAAADKIEYYIVDIINLNRKTNDINRIDDDGKRRDGSYRIIARYNTYGKISLIFHDVNLYNYAKDKIFK